MEVKFNIISFNKELQKRGTQLIYAGSFILFLNLIPGIYESVRMLIAGITLGTVFSGIFMINIAEYKKEKVGMLRINDLTIQIIEKDKSEINLIRRNFNFEIKYPGYEGKSNYKPFLSLGAFTSHSGINEIRIYNQQEEFKLDILIKNKEHLDALLALRT